MRTIKFRCWDGNKIINDPKIGVWEGTYSYSINNEFSNPQDNYIYMQFTGLHDKNGKEIYEGDIVMRNVYTVKSGKKDMQGPFEIVWDKEKSGFEYRTDGYQNGLFHEIHEIIGNIYENPELINQPL